jgi:AraC family transcriptional activator of pobA
LYGERPAGAGSEPLHIEDIPSRSRKYLWRISAHRHSRCQCLMVAAGTVTATLDARRWELTAPAVIVLPPGTVHSFRFGADTRGYVLTLDLDRLLETGAGSHQARIEALFSVPRAIDLTSDPLLAVRIDHLLAILLCEFKQAEPATPSCLWLACSALWIMAAAQGSTVKGSAMQSSQEHDAMPTGNDLDRMRRFRRLVETKFMRHLPVASYARQLGLSETSLNRLCRRLTGATAFDLIQQRLALEARRRLAYVTGSVAGIAAELGFADPAYFCRFFRRHTGVSPGTFRRGRTHAT